MRPAASASWSARSWMIGPRAVLMMYAVGFISAISRAPIRPRVDALRGQLTETKSERRITSSRLPTSSTFSPRSCSGRTMGS